MILFLWRFIFPCPSHWTTQPNQIIRATWRCEQKYLDNCCWLYLKAQGYLWKIIHVAQMANLEVVVVVVVVTPWGRRSSSSCLVDYGDMMIGSDMILSITLITSNFWSIYMRSSSPTWRFYYFGFLRWSKMPEMIRMPCVKAAAICDKGVEENHRIIGWQILTPPPQAPSS